MGRGPNAMPASKVRALNELTTAEVFKLDPPF
jgi:hypothetical protein